MYKVYVIEHAVNVCTCVLCVFVVCTCVHIICVNMCANTCVHV